MIPLEIRIIGLMSGTSLDGLDICYAAFSKNQNPMRPDDNAAEWSYRIIACKTESYPTDIKAGLAGAQNMTALEYASFDAAYGVYLGQRVNAFIAENNLTGNLHPHYIASHGTTIFHQPENGFTTQIGSGAHIAAQTGISCICNFRATDVALGGQGAPLVPVGDMLLFADYNCCLNLGGFANISYGSTVRKAFDICPVNFVLNHYTRLLASMEYDANGNLARSGTICTPLVAELDALPYYAQTGPKTLGREWVEQNIFPLIDAYRLSHNLELKDILATWCEHSAAQIAKCICGLDNGSTADCTVLVTGGGTYNTYLMERMRAHAPRCHFAIPSEQIIDFKEALIFAFLGALYITDTPNCLSSVTGAGRNSIGGALYK